MSDTKWTPGPWKIINGDLKNPKIHQKVGPITIKNGVSPYDVALIAAAPDLYEALVSIENDDDRISKAIWDMRNNALAKARGEHND